MTIRNVIFDIGNVIVRWDPHLIVERAFGQERASDAFVQSVFPGENVWLPLNRGEISAEQAMLRYQQQLGLTAKETDNLWAHILESLDIVPGAIELMEQLSRQGYHLFALSDNVHEVVAHLKFTYDFWRFFEGAVISAEVGLLKPDTKIYRHLLDTYAIEAEETIFLDDVAKNIEGAKSVGINAIQFSTANKARLDIEYLIQNPERKSA